MKLSIIKTLLAFAAMAVASAAPVAAQELKIGYVNGDRVLREAVPAKAAQAKIEAEFSKRGKDLEQLEARLKAAGEKFEKDAPLLVEAERTRRQRELVDQDREAQRRRRELQEDLAQRKNEEVAAIVERTNRVIKQIFEAEKYDLIVQEAVFFSPRVDITDKVIKALNTQGGK